MKYLLEFLKTSENGPDLEDPAFRQLLTDVQHGKAQVKSADAFYDNLEKVVNELKSTPESAAFQKPVAKREAPDYYDVIKRPMDLSTVLRNVKNHKYKNKADFQADLDLIWENCLTYNAIETHPLRVSARYMKQKADHHLEFLADKNDRGASLLPLLPALSADDRAANGTAAEDDVAAESDSEIQPGQGFRKGEVGSLRGGELSRRGTPVAAGRARSASRASRGTSVSAAGERAGSSKPNGAVSKISVPARPSLQTSLDSAQALIRSPHGTTHCLPISLNQPGPSFSDKGKARELIQALPAPSWYPAAEDEDGKLEGAWWTAMGRDEAYVGTLPLVPLMAPLRPPRRHRIPRRRASLPNGTDHVQSPGLNTPSLVPSKPVSLENAVHRSVDKLFEARRVINQIQEFQRIEESGGVLPRNELDDPIRQEQERAEKRERKRKKGIERQEGAKRRKRGGEVGETEATLQMKRGAASMLAHAGFEGANEIALDMFTKVAVDHLRNVGRTFRLYLDGFCKKFPPDEIVLHALHENGQMEPADLETHIKDEIEREGGKLAEMARKVRQAYKEVTTAPVIEDDMIFNDNGEMLLDGNFAEELGEDFLGFRDLGIDKEFGLSSLSVPSSVFYGRRKRNVAADSSVKVDQPDYTPAPPFIPLNPATIHTHLPALFHAFYASRVESGLGVAADDPFDAVHSQIGSLGQIVIKAQPAAPAKKKKEVNVHAEAEAEAKKEKVKKAIQPGVGKGNWVRPPKEERERRAAEKRAALEKSRLATGGPSPSSLDAAGEEEDAEGEEE